MYVLNYSYGNDQVRCDLSVKAGNMSWLDLTWTATGSIKAIYSQ